jgi:hypothetical protein
MPREPICLWTFVAELDHDSRMALFAHCVALTVNAVKLPWDRRRRALAAADRLTGAVALDMTGYWRPTVRTYLGRVTKAGILEAVREGASEEAPKRMSAMKKAEMVQAATGARGNQLAAFVAAHGGAAGADRCAKRGAWQRASFAGCRVKPAPGPRE